MKISTAVIFASVLVLCIAAYTEAAATSESPQTGMSSGNPSGISTVTSAKMSSMNPKMKSTNKMTTGSNNPSGSTPKLTTLKPVTTTSGASYTTPSVLAVLASAVTMLLKVYVH